MILYHCTTSNKVQKYLKTGYIRSPVRGFDTLQGAIAWGWRSGRNVILRVEGEDAHMLPDHHNKYGKAYWINEDIQTWKSVVTDKRFKFGEKDDSHKNIPTII